MDNSLAVVDAQVLTPEEQKQLDVQIDRIISSHRKTGRKLTALYLNVPLLLRKRKMIPAVWLLKGGSKVW